MEDKKSHLERVGNAVDWISRTQTAWGLIPSAWKDAILAGGAAVLTGGAVFVVGSTGALAVIYALAAAAIVMISRFVLSGMSRQDGHAESLVIDVATSKVNPVVEKLEWRAGDQSDPRKEYRHWWHVVFIVKADNKTKLRAFIEVQPPISTDQKRARIASSSGWHAHQVSQVPSGEQLSVPVLMRLEEDTTLWLDVTGRRGVLGASDPKPVKRGSYITDDPFLNELHRAPLASGKYRLRVVLSLDAEGRNVEVPSDWREVIVE